MLKLANISKVYRSEKIETHALSGLSLAIEPGQFVAIMGPSGCGKSTLLNILGLLDTPTAGEYWFQNQDIARHSEAQLTQIRRSAIGIIFQSFNLIGNLSVRDNVEVGLLYREKRAAERRRRVAEAMEKTGIAFRGDHRPHQLSGGQQQRVAIARAIVSSPKLILADEPTGNLDSENGQAVLQILRGLAAEGASVIMATHQSEYASHADQTIRLQDGRIAAEPPQMVA